MSLIAPLPAGPAAPFFDDRHRALTDRVLEAAQAFDLGDVNGVAQAMGETGLYRAAGMDTRVDVRALSVLREALAYTSPLADAVFAVQGLGLEPLRSVGGHDELVQKAVAGEHLFGFALTEPGAGSDVASMTTRATDDGDAWVLDGEKTFISNVGIADWFVVFANADPSRGKKGISAFLVEASALECHTLPMVGDHPLGRLVMERCRIPKNALLGNVGDGLRLALGTLDVFRTSVGAAALGMAWRAIDASLHHVGRRRQFGRKLAEFQLVQAAVAEMVTEFEASRLLVAATAHAKDQGTRAPERVAMAKMFATENAQKIIDRAVQLHGGLGVIRGSIVDQLYRDVRPLRIYEGTTEILKLVIGDAYLGPKREGPRGEEA